MIHGRTVAMSLIAAAMAVCLLTGPRAQAENIELGTAPRLTAGEPHNARIESNLFNLVNQERRKAAGESVAGPQLTAGPAAICNGMVQAYIVVEDASAPIIEVLELEGAVIQLVNEDLLTIQAMIPFDALESIATLPFVTRVSQPDYGIPNFGSVTTEGDVWTRARDIRKLLGLTGKDQNVVVFAEGLDDGTSITARLFREGDIPERELLDEFLWCFGFPALRSNPTLEEPFARLGGVYLVGRLIGPTTFSFPALIQLYVAGSEGFALMEVVHDLAPDANLYFKLVQQRNQTLLPCPGRITSLDLIAARHDMVAMVDNSFLNPTLVVDPFTFFNSGNYDGTGDVSVSLATMASTHKLPTVVSAGNFAQSHWSGIFTDDPNNVNGIHNFKVPGGGNPADETLEIDIPPGGRAEVYLLWNDPFVKGIDDIDLYVLNAATLDFSQPLGFSVTRQGQNFNNPPREQVCAIPNPGGPTGQATLRASVIITRKVPSLAPSNRMDLYVVGAKIVEPEYRISGGSIPNNADVNSDWVMTIGAADINSMPTPTVQPYSGRGPTIDGRLKPDFISFDNVSVNTSHLNPYVGTSAATAHAGGLLALAFEAEPGSGFIDNQMLDKLRASAQDMDAVGPDNNAGYGLLDVAAYVLPNFSAPDRFTGQYFETFESNTSAGWVVGDAAASGLTPAGSGVKHGGIFLEVKDVLTFGFWQLTAPVLDAMTNRTTTQAGKLYEVRFRVRADKESNQFPDFRLRVGTTNNQEFAVLMVQNGPVASLYPTKQGRNYVLHYLVKDPEFANQELILSFDLLGFDPHVPPGSRVYLDEVEVLEIDPNLP